MTTAQSPMDTNDHDLRATREDACSAAPQASIGAPAGGIDSDAASAPAPVHGDTMRDAVDDGADGEDADMPVYDDRTDDRPAP